MESLRTGSERDGVHFRRHLAIPSGLEAVEEGKWRRESGGSRRAKRWIRSVNGGSRRAKRRIRSVNGGTRKAKGRIRSVGGWAVKSRRFGAADNCRAVLKCCRAGMDACRLDQSSSAPTWAAAADFWSAAMPRRGPSPGRGLRRGPVDACQQETTCWLGAACGCRHALDGCRAEMNFRAKCRQSAMARRSAAVRRWTPAIVFEGLPGGDGHLPPRAHEARFYGTVVTVTRRIRSSSG